MAKAKRDVKWWRAKMSAVARCTEGLDDDGTPIEGEKVCGWQCPTGYFFSPSDAEIRQQAKEHARFKPGHIVHVTVRDVASYWCEPDEDEAATSAPLPPSDAPTP